MNKNIVIYVSIVAILLFSGCASSQPTFSSTPSRYEKVDGRYYLVPKNTDVSPSLKQEVVNLYSDLGLTCNKGDVIWIHKATRAKYAGKKNYPQYAVSASKKGLVGCARPVSKKQQKQLDAYFAQQRKINNDPRVIAARANQSAALLNYRAATAPKTVNYNVNHSGYVNSSSSVYHYGY